MKKTRSYTTLFCALTVLSAAGAGAILSGCRPAPPAKKPAVAPAGGAGAVREKQVQQYILKRRAAARNSRRSHTSH